MPTNKDTQAAGAATLTRDTLRIGGRYNWKGQPERLVYMGCKSYRDNGSWHQFALTAKPDSVWCEVRESDLASFEETQEAAPSAPDSAAPSSLSAAQALEALDELTASARGDEPFNHFAEPLIRRFIEAAALTPPAQAPAIQAPEAVAVQSVELTRDSQGMCVVKINGREAIRDNGDIIGHFATLDWLATPSAAVSAGPVPDESRLSFVLEKSAFIVWSNRDGSIRQCQLQSQDEDEVYTVLSGMHRYFNTEREAIDAALSLATPAPAPTQPQQGTGSGS